MMDDEYPYFCVICDRCGKKIIETGSYTGVVRLFAKPQGFDGLTPFGNLCRDCFCALGDWIFHSDENKNH